MEFSIETIASKMCAAIIGLSVLVIAGAAIFFHASETSDISAVVPFAVGVMLAMVLNLTKVWLLKRVVTRAVDMDNAVHAGRHMQLQYFLRFVLTIGVLLIAALSPDNIVDIVGAVIGLFTFPIAMRLMRFYVPKDVEVQKPQAFDPVQDTISKIDLAANDFEKRGD